MCRRLPGRWGGAWSFCFGARLPRGGEVLPSQGPQGPGRGPCRYILRLDAAEAELRTGS